MRSSVNIIHESIPRQSLRYEDFFVQIFWNYVNLNFLEAAHDWFEVLRHNRAVYYTLNHTWKI
jgi:hypothetical protein